MLLASDLSSVVTVRTPYEIWRLPPLSGRDDGQDGRTGVRRQRVPGVDHLGQIGVDWRQIVTNCSAFCSACFRFLHTSRRKCLLFKSYPGSLPLWHLLAIRRFPMQNRGLRAEGQFALRPRARQNGGLLQRILQRFGEVVVGHLKVVLRRDGLGVANPLADDPGPLGRGPDPAG